MRKFSKCGRPDQVYAYQGLDADGVELACGEALAETALENLVVAPDLLERLAARTQSNRDGTSGRPSWRELWPDAPAGDHR